MRPPADRGRVSRLVCTAAFTGLLLTALPLLGRAQQAPGITLEVGAGFNGCMRVKHWSPVRCLVTNQSPTRLKGEPVVNDPQ